MRLAQTAAQHLHQLQGHAHARQDGAGAVRVALRIGHGHAFRHKVHRLVVVGDSQAQTRLHHGRGLRLAGDAAVHRDDEVGAKRARARDGGLRQRVALLETQRNEGRGLRAEGAQTAGEHGGGRDAVEVEVAEHEDVVAALDGGFQGIGHVGQAGDDVGVQPVALERRREEAVNRSGVVDAAGDQRRCDEAGQTEFALQAHDGRGVGRFDLELGRHGSHTSHARIRIVHVPLSHNRTAKSPKIARAARANTSGRRRAQAARTFANVPGTFTSNVHFRERIPRADPGLPRFRCERRSPRPSELPWVAFCAHRNTRTPRTLSSPTRFHACAPHA